MPYIVYGDIGKTNYSAILAKGETYDYKYPSNLNLHPSSDLHAKIVNEVLQRALVSHRVMSNRHDAWNEIDRSLTAYIEPDTSGLSDNILEESNLRDNKQTRKKPISIVFPYSYAILETILTYLAIAFFEQPIFRFEGVSPEDTIGAILLEKTIELHTIRNKVILALHTMFRDSLAYGLGIAAPGWQRHFGGKVVQASGGFVDFLGRLIGGGRRKELVQNELLFEGNSLEAIDPYLWFPDPNVPCDKIQKGEFCGWLDRNSYVNLLNNEVSGGEEWFNVRYLRGLTNKKSSLYGEDKSKRSEKTGVSVREAGGRFEATEPVDVMNMYVNLIPNDWGISTSEYPEKWLFSVASDALVIRAKPLGLTHNMYPIVIAAPDSDGYTPTPVSRLEILHGLQGVLDWLLNSHITNVRKAINDMIVYDPYLINSKDIENPRAGKLIRMRRPAWGRGVEHAVMQLKVEDITRANVQDAAWIIDSMQKVGGADDPMMGSLRRGGPERLTKGEFQGTQTGAVNRLQRIAIMIGVQAMQDIGYMFGSHTQQLATMDHYIKCTGEWRDELLREYGSNVRRERVKASPFDLLIDYDVIVRDGSVPGGGFSEAWMKMFNILATNKELNSRFDIVRIFRHIARNLGAKNITDFERSQVPQQAKLVPDEEALRGAEAGNLIPVEGGLNV